MCTTKSRAKDDFLMLAALYWPVFLLAEPMRVIVFGDWGGTFRAPYVTRAQMKTAIALDEYVRNNTVAFLVNVGDSFYEGGIDSVHSTRWNSTFENVYNGSTLKQLRWYCVAGNHDHGSKVSAEIAYSKVSERWYFPSLFYTFTRYFRAFDWSVSVSVQFVMTDSESLTGDSKLIHDHEITNTQRLELVLA
jgi:tartrate-resistant acid phosphatase type 5